MTDTAARRSPRFLALYALANAGGVFAYVPLLQVLLPVKVGGLAGADRIGLLTVAMLVGGGAASIANIVFGIASDRTYAHTGSRKAWVAAGLVVTVLSYAGLYLAATRVGLVVGILVYQVALNMMLAPLFAIMADEVPDGQKGVAGALLAFANPFGALVGGVLAGSGLAEGARFAVVCAGVVAMVAPLLAFGRSLGGTAAVGDPTRAMRPLDLALIWLARLAFQTATNVLFTYLIFYFDTVAPGGDMLAMASRVGTLTGILLFAAVPVALIVGRISDRAGARQPFLAGAAVVTAIGLALMAAAGSVWPAVAGFALFAAGTATFIGLHSAYAMQSLPSARHRGRDLGVLNLANTVPALLGPALAWWLASATGGFGALFAVLAAMTLAAGLFVTAVRDRE